MTARRPVRSRSPKHRPVLLPAGIVACSTTLLAAPFPEPSQLPVQPTPPDPLVRFDGQRVSTAREWYQQRRPELKALFQHYMYGSWPSAPAVRATVERMDTQYFGGKATKKEVALALGPDDAPVLHLLVVVPNGRRGPAPVFVGLAFCPICALVNDPNLPLPTNWMYPGPGVRDHRATAAIRGSAVGTWSIEQTIDRGYGVAIFYNGDVEPDYPEAPEGIRAWYARHPAPASAGTTAAEGGYDWGAIAAWAWGARRVVDYLVTDKAVDARRIAVVGHSRNGKASLVAGAFDERIALVIPHQAGCGGTAPSRGTIGESVQRINTSFPHWFNAPFKQFNDQPQRLPFDQNSLIALCAPRPVLVSNATEDSWGNPDGQFEMVQGADPVYRFLKAGGLAARQMPPTNQLVASKLGFFIRPGKHSMTPEDWRAFLDFADKELKPVRPPRDR